MIKGSDYSGVVSASRSKETLYWFLVGNEESVLFSTKD